MRTIRLLSVFPILIFSLLACASYDMDIPAADPHWDDCARFLAGMPVPAGSPFSQAASTAFYNDHRVFMDGFWKKVEEENISRINAWRGDAFRLTNNVNLAFYPLSGADFVNLYTVYPKCNEYLMVALEEPGAIPDPLSMKPAELSSGLSCLRRVMWSIASQNYFKSAVMGQEMSNRYLDGTLPVLLVFTARLGHKILSVEPVVLSPRGEISVSPWTHGVTNDTRIRGYRIRFLVDGERRARSLTYLRMRLGEKTMDMSTEEGRFLSSLPPFAMMTKSAIYLFHSAKLRETREYLLSRSKVIVQDDSGIPYRCFDKTRWDIMLYGVYSRPPYISDLPNPPEQADLAAAYRAGAAPLPFNFGYGVLAGRGRSNLMYAVRRER